MTNQLSSLDAEIASVEAQIAALEQEIRSEGRGHDKPIPNPNQKPKSNNSSLWGTLKEVIGLNNWNNKEYSSLSEALKDMGQTQVAQAKESKQQAPKRLRNIATIPGAVADLPLVAWNLPAAALGGPTYSMADATGKYIDNKTNGLTRPQEDYEKIEEVLTQNLGSMLPGAGAGSALVKGAKALGTGKTANVIKKLGKGYESVNRLSPRNIAGTAVASSASQHILNEDPTNLLGALGASVAGNYGVNKVSNTLKRIPAKDIPSLRSVLAEKIDYNPNNYEALTQAGVRPLLGDVSNLTPLKRAQNILKDDIISNKKIRPAVDKQFDTLTQNIEGNSLQAFDQVQGGEKILQGAHNYNEKYGKLNHHLAGKVQGHLNKAISENPANRLVNIESPLKFLGEKFYQLETGGAKEAFLKSHEGKEFINLLELGGFKLKSDPATVSQAFIHHPKVVPWEDLMQARRNLDKRLAGEFDRVSDSTRGSLKNLRSLIKKSQSGLMENLSPEAKKDWNRFNKVYSQYAENVRPNVNEIFEGKTKPEIFQAIKTNLHKDGRLAETAAKGLKGEDRKALSMSLVTELGSNKQNEFTIGTFARNFKSLEKPVQNIVVSGLNPQNQKKFLKTIEALEILQDTASFGNPSQTALTNNIVTFITGASTGTTTLMTGNIAPLASFLIGRVALPKIGSRLFTNDKFINNLHKAVTAKTPEQIQNHLQRLSQMSAVKKALAQSTPFLTQKPSAPSSQQASELSAIDAEIEAVTNQINQLEEDLRRNNNQQ